MTAFEHGLEAWSEDRAQAFMEQRRQQAMTGAASIIAPGTTIDSFPFWLPDYAHASLIRNQVWDKVRDAEPGSLIPVDPFEASEYRDGGLKLWDAVVGIPPSAIAATKVVKTRLVPTNRTVNQQWCGPIMNGLARVGRLGGGEFMRPSGPFICDLMMDPMGWRMLEAAHALAHRAAALKPREWKKAMCHAGSTYFHTQRFLTQLCVCRAFGLPLDVLCLDEGLKGMPDIVQYGIEIKSSSYFRSPIMKLPALNGEAPRPDTTLAVVQTGVYIEPHPHGFTTESGKWLEVNRWACSPTIIVIAGWELVDVITHQTLCSSDPADSREPLCYGMAPADLQSPETFWAFLRYAAKHRGMPKVDNQRYWFVEDWLKSPDLEALLMRTPPLPCMDCLRLNMRAEGAPSRPIGEMPKPRNKTMLGLIRSGEKKVSEEELSWIRWKDQLTAVHELVTKAVVYYEGRIYGHAAARKRRAQQVSGHAAQARRQAQIQKLQNAIAGAKRRGQISLVPALKAKLDTLIEHSQ